MPDFGIGEALGALGLGDALGLGGLFGLGGEAAGAAAGGAALGAGEAAGGATLADIVGTGTGLFGGATGLEGTALAAGAGGAADILGTAGGIGGLGALGTAADFLAAPGASGFAGIGGGFGAAADAAAAEAAQSGLASGVGSIQGTPGIGSVLSGSQPFAAGGVSSNLSPSVANANASASVFDTGTSAVPGVNAAGAPAAPGGATAASVAPPSGVTGLVDPTAAGGVAGQAGGAAGQTASTSISDLLSKAGSGALKSVTNNPLGIALGAGGLGYNILQGQKQSANQKALSADAAAATANSNKLTQNAEALQQYLTSGQLPPAYQQQVDQAIDAAKARAISNAASQGLPTDPTQNTTLAQTLAGIDNQRSTMQTQIAAQLFSSGSSLLSAGQNAAQLSGNLYQTLVNNDTASAANTGKAIATLAAALNGKNQASVNGITISQG